jgi:peptidoglycan/LPS O-acetylase OafA/YrhL
MKRFQSLDGWRGISIIMVLLGHLFPIGPKAWHMNNAVAGTGMAIFFILSGFLMVNLLIKNDNIFNFLTKRFLRIIPLAWLIMLIFLTLNGADENTYISHLFFYANWPPMTLISATGHLWSLCVEMQFYIGIALLMGLFKSRALMILPLICIGLTIYRYLNSVEMAINTYYRLDELLAGCILAVIYHKNKKIKLLIGKLSFIYLLPLLIFSAHPSSGILNYMRPYIAMLVVGSTLFNKKNGEQWLESNFLLYVATISYAVYVLHGSLSHTWLGRGEVLEKYIKRPLLLGVVFLLAHISTFYYEKYWINFGRKLVQYRLMRNKSI